MRIEFSLIVSSYCQNPLLKPVFNLLYSRSKATEIAVIISDFS